MRVESGMQNGTWLRAQHYRDMAASFRRLAETEPLASLRRHLRRLAVQHDEAATGLETPQSDEQRVSGEEKRRR